jgi:diguanylate cyclase (GGDEF)-like protein/PAS domain S-box-containing protein
LIWQLRIIGNVLLAGVCLPLAWMLLLFIRSRQSDYVGKLLESNKAAEVDNALAASVFSVAMEAIVVMDAKTHVLSVNPAFTAMTGYSAADVVGRRSSVMHSGLESKAFYTAMWGNIRQLDQWQGQLWRHRKNGEPFLTWQSVRMLRDANGEVFRYISVFSDITELHRKSEQLRHQALHDSLTGLPNRLLLQDRLDHAIGLARREGGRVAVLFIDLDHFKDINDSLGHDAGDMLLKIVTLRLQSGLRQSDTVARLGGDEFVVALSNIVDAAEVETVAQMLLTVLLEPVELGEHTVRVGASIGGAIYPDHDDGAAGLMRKADEAMYQAKTSGRHCFCLYSDGNDAESLRQVGIGTGLRRALDHGEFVVYYQPRINLLSGGLCGAEALVRWNCPTRGLLLPEQFLSQAEESGTIHALGDWVIESICNQIVNWRMRDFPPVPIAINLSGLQLSPYTMERICELLASHSILPGQLEIDVSGCAIMHCKQGSTIDVLVQLHKTGVIIALDDFGQSNVHLQELAKVPLDLLKINRAFVRDVDHNPNNAKIVDAIMSMAASMGVTVVAEGVETDDEEHFLRGIGCDYAQGFKYGRPQAALEFERWFERAALSV